MTFKSRALWSVREGKGLIYRAPEKFLHNFERLKIFGVITRSSKMPVLSFFLSFFLSLS